MQTNGVHRTRGIRALLLVVVGFVAVMPAAMAPAAGAVENTCRATNATQGGPTRASLQRVLDAADRGDEITVKGVCVGTFRIRTSVSLIGRTTLETPTPVLHAGGADSYVLGISRGVVRLTNLKITGGGAGGIYNSGKLFLGAGVLVRGNTTTSGGGIFTERVLVMTQDARVSGNEGTYGGGIFNFEGRVVLRGSASVSGNTAAEYGGGILNSGGILRLEGASTVARNTSAGGGGGVGADGGTIVLKDAASVTGNSANTNGGGIRNFGGVLQACDGSGVHEWTGAISPNTPDDPPAVSDVTCT